MNDILKMERKIIILSQMPLTPQIDRNTYYSEMLNADIDVEFWDISKLIHPKIKLLDEKNHINKVKINDIEVLNKLIEANNSSIFILDFDLTIKNIEIFKILKKNNSYTIRIDSYANTGLYEPKKEKLKRLINTSIKSPTFFYRTFKNNFFKIITNLILSFKFNRFLSSSRFSNRTDAINHPDYDEYMSFNRNNEKSEDFILFIDTFFGLHPDLKNIFGIKKKIDIELYYEKLNQFFDYVEKKFDLPVVIALHPKANYETNVFNNRRMIKYKTLELIFNAKYVIAQVCNTFSWISLCDKPVALVSDKIYESLYINRHRLKNLSSTLNIPIQNLDIMGFDKIRFEKIPNALRIAYINNYLTDSEIENKSNIDILKTIISDREM